jgi:hypothetical protein
MRSGLCSRAWTHACTGPGLHPTGGTTEELRRILKNCALREAAGVKFAYGEANGQTTMHYVARLEYDKFGRRAYVDRNNRVETIYTYDTTNGRLKRIMSDPMTTSIKLQDVNFTYDNADNITQVANNVVKPKSGYGGPAVQNYTYDDLYRLKTADGNYLTNKNKYTLTMDYDNIHNITRKNQKHWLVKNNGSEDIQTGTTYDWNYAYAAGKPHAPSTIGGVT